jgi:hypothetical protein
MSLLSVDITKVKRLSLKEIKLPTRDLRVEAYIPKKVDRPPTEEEVKYSKLVEVNPLLEDLVERFDLVSNNTGARIKLIQTPTRITDSNIFSKSLLDRALSTIPGEDHFSKTEIINRINKEINTEDSEKIFNLLLDSGELEATPGGDYYLSDSVPF